MSSTTLAIVLPSTVAVAAIGSAVWQNWRTLAHDREMHDVSLIRSILDEAIAGLEDTDKAVIAVWEAAGLEHAVLSAELYEELEPQFATPERAANALEGPIVRLTLLLGENHSVVTSCSGLREALLQPEANLRGYMEAISPGGSIQSRRGLQESHARVQDVTRQFLAAATALVGARIGTRS